ncbi:MAG: hypothetical protein ACFFAS_10165 [Promethearchaeota archaeon]
MASAYFFSTLFYFSQNINIFLWKVFIVSEFANYGFILLIFSSLEHNKKKEIVLYSVFAVLIGIIVGGIISPVSITIEEPLTEGTIIFDPSQINYKFQIHLSMAIIMFCIYLLFIFSFRNVSTHIHSRNKQASKLLLYINMYISIPIIALIVLSIVQNPIIRDLHFISLFMSYLISAVMFIKKPDLGINLTNKVYSINLYHKSGVLLYSYKFEFETPDIQSDIWGNIVIGLNHIVGEFIDKKDQIDVLKTKSADIIVDYNNEIGFAVLVMTNKLNAVLSTIMHNFTQELEVKFEKELRDIQDLNNLIDVSDFKGVESLIRKHFSIYF